MTIYRINQKFLALPSLAAPARPSVAGGRSASAAPPPPSDHVLAVAEMFGIGLNDSYEVAVCEDLRLDVRPGDVVYVTGPSGSGKSVLLARLVEAIRAAEPGAVVVDLAQAEAPADRCVIDGLGPGGRGLSLEEALRLVSTAGLADAFVLLRRPAELSDGQRWRLRLAHALARLWRAGSASPCLACCAGQGRARDPHGPDAAARTPVGLLVADELASTLDRLCARAVAYRLRRLADQWGVTVLAASAHEDLAEDLSPDVLVLKEPGPRAAVYYADPSRYDEEEP